MRRQSPPEIAVAISVLVLAGCRRDEVAKAPGEEMATPPVDEAADTVTTALTETVAILGTVIDQTTGDAVAGAIVIVLEPGISSQEWGETRGRQESQALMEAVAMADERGHYEISDLQRERSYTVMVTAAGYAPAIFEDGLEVAATDPAIIRMQPIELERV